MLAVKWVAPSEPPQPKTPKAMSATHSLQIRMPQMCNNNHNSLPQPNSRKDLCRTHSCLKCHNNQHTVEWVAWDRWEEWAEWEWVVNSQWVDSTQCKTWIRTWELSVQVWAAWVVVWMQWDSSSRTTIWAWEVVSAVEWAEEEWAIIWPEASRPHKTKITTLASEEWMHSVEIIWIWIRNKLPNRPMHSMVDKIKDKIHLTNLDKIIEIYSNCSSNYSRHSLNGSIY